MYQLHFKPATSCYCLRLGEARTRWLPSIPQALHAPLNMPVGSVITFDRILLYEGSTIPTIHTHPELFL